MAVPTTLESLSPTAQADPVAGDNVSAGDDNLRSAFQLLRQTVTAGSDIASASTITPASTGSSFNLTGVTTVTAIGSTNAWDGRIVWFRHTGAHAFTNSATLVCLGGASITFASGDISAWRQRTSGTWDQVAMFRALRPLFRAYRSSSQTSGTTFIFDTEVTDQGSCYNNATGVFTAPVAGVYSFSCSLYMTQGGPGTADYYEFDMTASTAGIIARTTIYVPEQDENSGSMSSGPVRLAAGETVSVSITGGLVSPLRLSADGAASSFSGYLIEY